MSRKRLGRIVAVLLLVPAGLGAAAELHVATRGDDRASGSAEAPFRSIRRGLAAARPGDTLLLHAGSYAERISTEDGLIEGGDSWANALTIAAVPGDRVVLRPASDSSRVVMLADPNASFIVIRGLLLDARNVSHEGVKITWSSFGPSNASHHIRIEDSEVMNAPGQGLLLGGNHNELLRMRIHDNGRSDLDHGVYIAGADNLVDGCEVYRNAGWGVHVYNGAASDADRNRVINNRLRDNARVGRRGAGVILSSGEDNSAVNNVIFGNAIGIQIGPTGVRSRVYHNTIFAQSGVGIGVDEGAVASDIRNNLLFANPVGIRDGGFATVLASNLVTIDPGVVDAAAFDVHLLPSSAAIDAGETLEAVPSDHDGRRRPGGAGYDVGAYEALGR